jgi:multisubunit Na+/H+ antiporter MnhG subunit
VSSSLTWLALLFVVITGPILSHATIRAIRIRETGDWRLDKADDTDKAGPPEDLP